MGSICDYVPEECQPRIRTDFHMSYCSRDCHPFTYYERIVIYMFYFGDMHHQMFYVVTTEMTVRSVETPFSLLHVVE